MLATQSEEISLPGSGNKLNERIERTDRRIFYCFWYNHDDCSSFMDCFCAIDHGTDRTRNPYGWPAPSGTMGRSGLSGLVVPTCHHFSRRHMEPVGRPLDRCSTGAPIFNTSGYHQGLGVFHIERTMGMYDINFHAIFSQLTSPDGVHGKERNILHNLYAVSFGVSPGTARSKMSGK